ncbi:uncharacterized protein [Gossypium hirsutum]|uniref:GAG-pre-integrase domain-containing protein n=1 Tax=Gossypium hirsutum TaxID=3635 RepID=A0ABM2YVI9_GOSHI|nr:uncharacterized protein LOC121208076 [Gossypium hirsutum]
MDKVQAIVEDIVEDIEAEIEVDKEHIDEAINYMLNSKQVTNIKHRVMDKELEAEVEAEEQLKKEENVESSVFLTYKESEKSRKNIWYLDNCAGNHMCGRKDLFSKLDENIHGQVTFGDKSHATVKGKGKVTITQKNGEKKFISDVYYVPTLKSNIISLEQLLEKGYEVHIKDSMLTLKNKSGELIAQVDMTRNRLFTIDIESGEVKCMKNAIKDESWLWHLRFGYLGFSGLKLLSKENMVNRLPKINPPDQLCKACIKGKQHR